MPTNPSARPTTSLEAANSYFQTRLRADAWFDADSATREAALNAASRILGRSFRFSHDARYLNENGVLVWREEIIDALCEEAFWLIRYDADAGAELAARGLVRAALAGAEATFQVGARSTLLCELARRYVGALGVLVSDESPLGELTSTPLAF